MDTTKEATDRSRLEARSDGDETMTQHTFDVEGMTCGSCVARVEKALRSVPGVENAQVNLVTRSAVVETSPAVDLERVAAAVVEAGYRVTPSASAGAGETSMLSRGGESGSSKGPDAIRMRPESAYAARQRRELEEERTGWRRAWVATLLTVPVLALGMSHGAWEFAESPAGLAIQFVLSTLVLLGPGAELFRLALAAARHRAVDMNTLIAIGSFSAWAASTFSWLASFGSSGTHESHADAPSLYFEAAATIVTFVLIGRALEHRTRRRLGDAVTSMRALAPEMAVRVGKDGKESAAPTLELRRGDLVRIRPGDQVPVDGTILVGRSVIDESLLTGESAPVARGIGDAVKAGTLNHDGTLLVEVRESGEATTLARIAAAVEEAQGSKAPIARVADRVAARFVPVVLVIAAITFAAWMIGAPEQGFNHALERAIAVLVIACPCALGLATPAAVAAGAGRAAELGVLFRNGEALESTARMTQLFLDKTGTLTMGAPSVVDVSAVPTLDATAVLGAAASVERGSAHPLAKAIVAEAMRRKIEIREPLDFTSEAGAGASGRVDSREVRIGTRSWLMSAGVSIASLDPAARRAEEEGQTVVFVSIDGKLAGSIALLDVPAEGAKEAVASLKTRGIRPSMLTGDHEGPANSIARTLGITVAAAAATPIRKAEMVREAKGEDRVVGMIGDGVNDAPALALADIGIAMGQGTDVAAQASDVTLLRGGIGSIVTAVDVARATLSTIHRNLAFAFGYNVLAIPLAAGVLEPRFGWSLSPMIASAAMAASSISVILSSLMLRRFSKAPTRSEVTR